MTTVIDTLAQLASDASLQSPAAIEQMLINSNHDESITSAILTQDITALERQLDVRPDIVCFIVPAEDDEQEKDEDKGDEGSTEEASNRAIGF